ncbi:MAG: hypothetical protein JRN39_00780 [Nitrososphaerota archaeon]|nr:hypothetical protein [Nitrososphaerota archaeon]
MVGVVAFFPLMDTLNQSMIIPGLILLEAEVGLGNSAMEALLGESFPIRYRYSGSGLSYQTGIGLINGLLVAAITPLAVLYAGTTGAAPFIVGSVIVMLVLSLVFITMIRESKKEDLAE